MIRVALTFLCVQRPPWLWWTPGQNLGILPRHRQGNEIDSSDGWTTPILTLAMASNMKQWSGFDGWNYLFKSFLFGRFTIEQAESITAPIKANRGENP